jgi:hypothetical protein
VRDEIDAVVESIVEAAQIPSRRRRADLRRELRSHFDESAPTAEALHDAVARFGHAGRIGDSFRQVYRRDYVLWYVVKVACCGAAAALAAVLIEALASVRLHSDADAWSLSPGFAHAAGFGTILAVALVATGEATRAPFTRSRALAAIGCYAVALAAVCLASPTSTVAAVTASILGPIGIGSARAAAAPTSRAALAMAGFAAGEYLLHRTLGVPFGPMRALAASAILLLLWASTIAIVAASDRAFARTCGAT